MKLARFFLAALLTLTFSVAGLAQEKASESSHDDLVKVDTVDQARAKRIPSQDSSLYVVSVKAGIVNLADGDVSYKHPDAEWDMLIGGDELRTGDIVKTGLSGRAEILLNPGSYLRIAENSEVVLADASLDNLKIQVLSGSAILEVSMGSGDKGIFATLITPHAKFLVVEGGIYRLNVDQSRSIALVRKGKLVLPQEGAQQVVKRDLVTIYNNDGFKTSIIGTVVKSKNKIVVEGTSPLVASLDKRDEDGFDDWSKDRAKTLVAANQRLSNRALNRSLLGAWGNSFWVYNPFRNCYTYLPGWYGFSSPYGYGYTTYCNPYYRRYYPTNGGTNNGGGYSAGSGRGNNGNGRSGGISGGDSRPGQGSGRGRDSSGSVGRPGSNGGGRGGNTGGGSISRPGGHGGSMGGGASRPSVDRTGSGSGNSGSRGSAPASPRRN